MDYREGEHHVIDRPGEYAFWRDLVPALSPPWPGRLLDFVYTHPPTLKPKTLGFAPAGPSPPGTLNLWTYRRLADRGNFQPGAYLSDISLINWPQNDYFLGNLTGVEPGAAEEHIRRAKQLSLSLLYWLQTEAPRPDGGEGWPGLRLRSDVVGSEDGLAKFPYVRESRRICAVFTVREQDCGRANRALAAGLNEAEVLRGEVLQHGRRRLLCDRPAPEQRGRQLHRLRFPAFPDPLGGLAAAASSQPLARRKESRHDPHHQRLLPAPPGRVEHRRGGWDSGRLLPPSSGTTPRGPSAPAAAGRVPEPPQKPRGRVELAADLRWMDGS